MAGWRTVRVFISSTFRDMHAERDYLVKVVFPELRERLEKHRVHLIDIDLRWGVTQEQADNDLALDLCLQQIDECRPFFVGLLGKRYGWVPRAITDKAVSKYGWIQHHTGKSITELEILYGVLSKPEMHSHSFFYFRDPSFIKDVPQAKRQEVEAEDDESAEKLAKLKDAIREAKLPAPPFEHYPSQYAGLRFNWRLARAELNDAERSALEKIAGDGIVDLEEYNGLDDYLRNIVDRFGVVHLTGLEAFGRCVHDQLWDAIKAVLELPDAPAVAAAVETDPLAEERDYHERFIESRVRIYVGRASLQRDLLDYVEGDAAQPMLVTGPSGSGKSSTMAHLCRSLADRDDVLLIPHFVGASPGSTSIRQTLRRLCLELKSAFDFEDEVPQDMNEVLTTFRKFIADVPVGRRTVIVIDALNQLDETDLAHEVYWLPREFAPYVKLLASCINDPDREQPILDRLRRLELPERKIEGLSGDERLEIVRTVPALSAKTLDPKQVGLLLSNPATENPLFLLVALEELRGFGSYEQLSDRIRAFPSEGDTVTAIFTQIIERLEEEFDRQLVRSVLSLLGSARQGLSQRELQELLSDHKGAAELFPVLRQLRPYLQHRGTLLDFFHRNLFKAVRERYLDTDKKQAAAHEQLAEYFDGQDYWIESLEEQRARARRLPPTPRPANERKVVELPRQRLKLTQLDLASERLKSYRAVLVGLFEDLSFLEAKTEAGLVFDLAAGFTSTINGLPTDDPKRRTFSLVEEALRRDIHFITRHPTTLFQFLWNSCWWYDCPEAEKHYIEPEGSWPPGEPPWEQPGPKLFELLRHWRAAKEQATPGFCWLRSLRPPALNLGTAQRVVFRGHEEGVRSVSFSPDGRRIASASSDRTIRIWDAESGAELRCLRGHEEGVQSVSFSPDGRRIASGSQDETVRVWDAESGAERSCLRGHKRGVYSVSFSPDGRRIVSGSANNVRVWDSETGAELRCLDAPGGAVRGVRFSPDGRRIVSGSANNIVRAWDAETGAELRCLRGPGHPGHAMWSVSFSPEGRRGRIVSGAWDKTVRVWDAESGGELYCLHGHEDPVGSVSFSPDGRRIVSGSDDNTVRVWDAEGGNELRCLRGHENKVSSVSFSPDGRRIVSGSEDNTVRVWGAESGADLCCLRGHNGHRSWVYSVSFSPDGQRIASGSHDRTVRVWDAESGAELSCLRGHEHAVHSVSFSPDGRRIVSGSFLDKTICLWDAESGAELRCLRGHENNVSSVSFSPDGRRIVSGSHDATVRVWDAESGAEIRCLRCDEGSVWSVSFSPDGWRVAIAAGRNTVRLWDAESGAELRCLRGHKNIVTSVSFSPDGRRIASGSRDNTVRVWDAENGECLEVSRGAGDVAAIAAGTARFPWRALARGLETVVESAATGDSVAWFPGGLSHISTHPFGRTWAGSVHNHLHILTLEGADEALLSEATEDEA